MSYAVAMLSVHTSPLDSPGRTKDAGGMNVYMRELASELGHRHTTVDIFTRWTNESSRPSQLFKVRQARLFGRKPGQEFIPVGGVVFARFWG